MPEPIRILGEETLSRNWAVLKKVTFEIKERDGQWRRHEREVYDRGNAAVILLYDPARHTVLLTRQFRLPVQVNGGDPWLIEACAGLLDGDDPETCIRKEALEETGYLPRTVTHLFDSYMSPGSVTERLSFFLGEYDETGKVAEGGGLAGEGEDIEVLELPFDEALGMIGTGTITDAKTIMLLHYLALNGAVPSPRAPKTP